MNGRPAIGRPLVGWLIAAAAALAAVGVAEWSEWPFLRAPLERGLSRALDRGVSLGPEFGVRLIGSVRLRTDLLVVASGAEPPMRDAQGRPRDLLRARAARLVLPYSTVWRGLRGRDDAPLEVESLSVSHLELNLVRDTQGRTNWRLGGREPGPVLASTAPPAPPEQARFGALVVTSGVIRLDDAPLQLSLEAMVRTAERDAPTSAKAGGTGLEVRANGRYRELPLRAHLQSSGILPLARNDEGAAAVPIRLDLELASTRLHLDGTARDVVHLAALDAAFRLSGPSLAAVGDALGLTLPTTAAFAMNGRMRKSGTVWAAAVAGLEIGSSRLHGDFRYDVGVAPGVLTGTLAGSRLALADLAPTIGAPVVGQPVVARPGRVLPQREFDIPSLHAMNADVEVRLDRVDLGTPQLEPLVPLRARLRLQDGRLGLHHLFARTSNGELRGALGLDARTAMPRWSADLRWAGVRLERFVKARNPRGRADTADARNPGAYVSGVLGGTAKVQGSGRSTAAALATLDGSVKTWARDGSISHLLVELAGIDVAESVGLMITGDEPLAMRCAVAQWALNKGRAVPEVGIVDTRDTTILVSGHVSLADESLALLLAARPHDVSPVALRAPVHLEGSFEAPRVRVDGRSIGLRLAAGAALAAVTPLASLLALLDFGEADREVCHDAVARARQSSSRPPADPPSRRNSSRRIGAAPLVAAKRWRSYICSESGPRKARP